MKLWINSRLNQHLLAKLHYKYRIFAGDQYWQSSSIKVWWMLFKVMHFPESMGVKPFVFNDSDIEPDSPRVAETRDSLPDDF